jgi:hypothetical protein
MKKALLFLASLALCGSVVWAGPGPAAPEPSGSAAAVVPANTPASDLLAAIFEMPKPQNATTPTCVTQTRCPSGLWLGCSGYTGPDACETYRNCVMCDGTVYRCSSGFCPY